jgi:hypothetical protein
MLAKKRGWRGPSTRFPQLEMQMTPHLLVSERLSNGAEKDANNLLYSNGLTHTKCCCTCRRLETLLQIPARSHCLTQTILRCSSHLNRTHYHQLTAHIFVCGDLQVDHLACYFVLCSMVPASSIISCFAGFSATPVCAVFFSIESADYRASILIRSLHLLMHSIDYFYLSFISKSVYFPDIQSAYSESSHPLSLVVSQNGWEKNLSQLFETPSSYGKLRISPVTHRTSNCAICLFSSKTYRARPSSLSNPAASALACCQLFTMSIEQSRSVADQL